MSATPAPTTADAALVLGVLRAWSELTKKAYDQAREIIAADYMGEGDRVTIRDPRNRDKLGTVSVTDPTPIAEVDDEDAFTAYVAGFHPDGMEPVRHVIRPERMAEVVRLLHEHAPHLLAETETAVKPWQRKTLLDQAAATGEPIPGVVVRTKRGHASVRLAAGAVDVFRELVAAGLVDPTAPLPALEAGGAA